MNELLAIGIILVAAVLLRIAVSAALARLGVLPADEERRSRGMRDVIARLRDRRR